MRNVLAAFDFSPLSKEALKTTGAVARLYDAKVHVLNVILRPPMIESALVSLDVLREERKRKIEETLRELNLEGNIIIKSTGSCVAHVIMETAEEVNADLIGLGRASVDINETDFIGTTVLTLKSISSIPLLVTTHRGRSEFRKVLVPVSEKRDSFDSIPFAVEFCRRAGCELTILNIFETAGFEFTQAEEDRIKEIFAENLKPYLHILKEVPYKLEIRPYDIASSGIVMYAHENQMDLIIMERRKKLNLIERLFYQSTTQRVMRASTVPVMVL